MPEAEERQHIRVTVAAIREIRGAPPLGWYAGRYGDNTRRLVIEETETLTTPTPTTIVTQLEATTLIQPGWRGSVRKSGALLLAEKGALSMREPEDGLAEVFAHIDANRDRFVERLMDYVRHPSISAQNKGVREVAALLVDMLTGLGLKAQAVPTKGHPMVLGRSAAVFGARTILLYGHYDVQPPDPLDAWISPPFEPTIRNGRIYARGIGDNKGQHFAQLLAIESLLTVTGALPCNVIVLLEGEEEVGSPHIAEFVAEHRDQLMADLVVTSDGPLHESGRPVLTFGVRGMAAFELRARTASRDAHSGNFGGVMPNAVWKLVHLLATMKNAAGQITIEGLCDQIIPPTDQGARRRSRASGQP